MSVFDVLREKLNQNKKELVDLSNAYRAFDRRTSTGYANKALAMGDAIEIVNQVEQEFVPKTNADRIRAMSDEELAEVYPCPYDTAGCNIMPCILDDNVKGSPDEVYCRKCMLNWLQKEVKE